MSDFNPVTEFQMDTLLKVDLMAKAKGLIGRGYSIRPSDNKIVTTTPSKSVDAPWYYTRQHPELNCNLWHHITFRVFDILPQGCMSCWKVVVRPRTVKELFMLLHIQEDHYKGACKLGMEEILETGDE